MFWQEFSRQEEAFGLIKITGEGGGGGALLDFLFRINPSTVSGCLGEGRVQVVQVPSSPSRVHCFLDTVS